MNTDSGKRSAASGSPQKPWRRAFARVPLLAWLCGALAAVVLEHFFGPQLADLLGLPKVPVLFGFLTILDKPPLIPSTAVFVILIYGLPILLVSGLLARPANRLAAFLLQGPLAVSVLVHLALLLRDHAPLVRPERLPGADP